MKTEQYTVLLLYCTSMAWHMETNLLSTYLSTQTNCGNLIVTTIDIRWILTCDNNVE